MMMLKVNKKINNMKVNKKTNNLNKKTKKFEDRISMNFLIQIIVLKTDHIFETHP